MGWNGQFVDEEAYYGCINCEYYRQVEFMKKFDGFACFLKYDEKLKCEQYKKRFEDEGEVMGDAEYIGVLIHEFMELLSDKYYECEDTKMKSHICFGLYTLMDLVTIIERERIDLDIEEGLKKVSFFSDDSAKFLVKKELDVI